MLPQCRNVYCQKKQRLWKQCSLLLNPKLHKQFVMIDVSDSQGCCLVEEEVPAQALCVHDAAISLTHSLSLSLFQLFGELTPTWGTVSWSPACLPWHVCRALVACGFCNVARWKLSQPHRHTPGPTAGSVIVEKKSIGQVPSAIRHNSWFNLLTWFNIIQLVVHGAAVFTLIIFYWQTPSVPVVPQRCSSSFTTKKN